MRQPKLSKTNTIKILTSTIISKLIPNGLLAKKVGLKDNKNKHKNTKGRKYKLNRLRVALSTEKLP